MSGRKHARAGLAAVVAIVALAIAVPAFAATVPKHVTETTIGGEKFVPNKMIADTMHPSLAHRAEYAPLSLA